MEAVDFDDAFDAKSMAGGSLMTQMTQGPSWQFKCLDCGASWVSRMAVGRDNPHIYCPDCENNARMPLRWLRE